MTTKIKNTESLKTSQGVVLATKGKLVLIKDQRDTCVGLIRCIKDTESMFPEDNRKVGDITIGVNISEGVFKYWEPIKPIIISETEEIEINDIIYHPHFNAGNLIKVTTETEVDAVSSEGYKAIGLPEQLSSEHLQAIVDGKLKDGDEVYVECCEIIPALDGTTTKEKFIAHNGLNHITLHKVEQKTYTKEDVIRILNLFNVQEINEDKWNTIEEWFEKYAN
jgi:hypothetical protein